MQVKSIILIDTETSEPYGRMALNKGDGVRLDWRDRWAYGVITDWSVPGRGEEELGTESIRIHVELARGAGGIWVGIGGHWPRITKCSLLEVLAYAASA